MNHPNPPAERDRDEERDQGAEGGERGKIAEMQKQRAKTRERERGRDTEESPLRFVLNSVSFRREPPSVSKGFP